jgi:alkanesulfonate monooxygenase
VLSVAQVLCCGRDEAELARRAAAVGPQRRGPAGERRRRARRPRWSTGWAPFGELGATRAYLQVLDLADLDHVELVASEVLPQLR